MRTLIITIMGLVLIGCGGGGGGGSSASPAPAPAPTPVAIENPTMQDLVVPDSFSYSPVEKSALNVDISGFSIQRAHLSVYKDFKLNSDGSYNAIYTSKVVSVPLINGMANFDFNVADSQRDLLVEIWFYDGSDPIQKVIRSGDNSWIL